LNEIDFTHHTMVMHHLVDKGTGFLLIYKLYRLSGFTIYL
jgi:hypothetical protein